MVNEAQPPHRRTVFLSLLGIAVAIFFGVVGYFKASGQTTTIQGPPSGVIQGPVTVGPGGAGINNGTIISGAPPLTQENAKHRAEIQNAIGEFIVRGDALFSRVMVPDDVLVERDASVWSGEVVKYVSDNLGPAYAARLNSGAGISGFIKHAPTDLRQQILTGLYVRVTRLHEFLKEMS